ncbi:ankyrin repeat domain-containing protein [Cognatishimia sp. MH4019]|uniref:ankyrin repeat domain-containing protein n=1 Tax=Cognatishimia sp. MH4019 TaxID=2854030 RepID=UPI001CD7646D|nr:ankyrin repeat domain-containing protein [Cognatishimia sp. MH4019]
MTDPLEPLKRSAKALQKAYEARDKNACLQVHSFVPATKTLKRADFLYVIARQKNFESWPKLKAAVEARGLARVEAQERLKIALFLGQRPIVDRLLADMPDLASDHFGLQIALYDRAAVKATLWSDPSLATRLIGPRRPILHLTFSRYHQMAPEREADMLAIAKMLRDCGADVNEAYPHQPGSDELLSALYGAVGHSGNMPLARWLLEHGADPNDGESLYHATELGHHEGLKLLLHHGATPRGTNALLRAMDFNDHKAVEMLLAAGADPNEDLTDHGFTALHQAARRMCDGAMANLLLQAGADRDRLWNGLTALSLARLHANDAVSDALSEAGATAQTDPALENIIAVVQGKPHTPIDPAKLPDAIGELLHHLITLPGSERQVERLVIAGWPWDGVDNYNMTPVQLAGWQGLPRMMRFFLRMKPDLGHVNGYGGTLLSTIIHGSENAPSREGQDHVGCLILALEEGVALPRPAIELAGREDVAEFLKDWAKRYPSQVVAHGIG